MEKLGRRFGRGRAVASVDGEVACEATHLLHHPAGRARCADGTDAARSSSDVHGNVAALDAALADIKAPQGRPHRRPRRPRAQRPAPGRDARRASWSSTPRARSSSRATPTSRSPMATTRPPSRGSMRSRARHQAAAEWARDQLADEQLDYLRRLPAERRLWSRRRPRCSPAMPRRAARRAACRPTSTPSLTVQRVTRTDARVIALRPHPRRGLARAGSQAHRQPGLLWLCLRWLARMRAGRSSTLPDDGDPERGAAPSDVRCPGGLDRGQRARPAR